MLTVMAEIPQLQSFTGRESAKYFVRTFGVSFIIAMGTNFLKSNFFNNYI